MNSSALESRDHGLEITTLGRIEVTQLTTPAAAAVDSRTAEPQTANQRLHILESANAPVSTTIRRAFDCLSKVTKCTVT